jgi:hypothetical protein
LFSEWQGPNWFKAVLHQQASQYVPEVRLGALPQTYQSSGSICAAGGVSGFGLKGVAVKSGDRQSQSVASPQVRTSERRPPVSRLGQCLCLPLNCHERLL